MARRGSLRVAFRSFLLVHEEPTLGETPECHTLRNFSGLTHETHCCKMSKKAHHLKTHCATSFLYASVSSPCGSRENAQSCIECQLFYLKFPLYPPHYVQASCCASPFLACCHFFENRKSSCTCHFFENFLCVPCMQASAMLSPSCLAPHATWAWTQLTKPTAHTLNKRSRAARRMEDLKMSSWTCQELS